MRKLVLLMLLGMFALTAKSQNVVWEWKKSFSVNNDSNRIYQLLTDNQFIYGVGVFFRPVFSYGSDTIFNKGGRDIFITKWDTSGNMIWLKSIGGNNADIVNNVMMDAQGNMTFGINTKSDTIYFNGQSIYTGGKGFLMMKTDANGNLIWNHHFGSIGDTLTSICLGINDTIYAAGKIAGISGVFKIRNDGSFQIKKSYVNPPDFLMYSKSDSCLVYKVLNDSLNHTYFVKTRLDTINVYSFLSDYIIQTAAIESSTGKLYVIKLNLSSGVGCCYYTSKLIIVSPIGTMIDSIFTNEAGQYVGFSPLVQSDSLFAFSSYSQYSNSNISLQNKSSKLYEYRNETPDFYFVGAWFGEKPSHYYTVPLLIQNKLFVGGVFKDLTGNDFYSLGKVATGFIPYMTNRTVQACQGTQIQLYRSTQGGMPPIQYQWSPTTGLSNPNSMITTASVNSNITYRLNMTDANGNIASDTINVIANSVVIPHITASDTLLCNSTSTVTLTANVPGGTWYFNNSSISTNQSVVVNASGTYKYVKNYICGTLTDSLKIKKSLSPPLINLNASSILCPGTLVMLTASGAQSYIWSGGLQNGIPFNTPSNITTYTVVATDANGCTNTSSVTITPTFPYNKWNIEVHNIANSDTICAGLPISLNIFSTQNTLPPLQQIWSPNIIPGQLFIPPSSQIYTASIIDTNGCTYSRSKSIVVKTNNTQLEINSSINCLNNDSLLANCSPSDGWLTWFKGSQLLSSGNIQSEMKQVSGIDNLICNCCNYCCGPMEDLIIDNSGIFYTSFNANVLKVFKPGNPVNYLETVIPNTNAIGNYSAPGLALGPDGSIYFSCTYIINGTYPEVHHAVYKFAPANNTPILVAGGGYSGNNPASFNYPTGLFVDSQNNLYIADAGNHRIQKWTNGASAGITVAGGNGSGIGANQLNSPQAIWVDSSGTVYIADGGNHRIQKWTNGASAGITVAGGNGQGNGLNQFNLPNDIAIDTLGNLYILDLNNYRVQKWHIGDTTGTTIAGGNGMGVGTNQLSTPGGIFLDKKGFLFIADGNRILHVNLNPFPKFQLLDTAGNYYALYQSLDGCSSFDSIQYNPFILTNTSVIALASDTIVCQGEQTILYGSGASAYSWSGGVQNNVAFTPIQSQLYFVSGIDTNGCTNSDSIYISVIPLPVITAIATDTSLCLGGSTTLHGMGGASYIWTGGVQNNISFSPIKSDTYIVSGTDSNGCVMQDSIYILVNPLPFVEAKASDTLFCGDGSSKLFGTGALNYSWSGGITNNQIISPTQTTTYTVTGTDVNGCTNLSSVTIYVYPKPPEPMVNFVPPNHIGTSSSGTYQWYFNNQPVPLTGPNYTDYIGNGIYQVLVTDSNGCESLSQPYLAHITEDWYVTPNPFTDELLLTLHIPENEIISCTLFDGLGNIIKKTPDQFDVLKGMHVYHFTHLENLPHGVYFLQVILSEERRIFKVVK
ncbi:MAG: hypothetical protein JNJ58_08570 [Chitinophagaceae bacterium]|nr:hypothetical protein [Chitinophagaceae bacterium]